MDMDAKGSGILVPELGDRAGPTGVLGGSGSYHGVIVAVHHEGAPASEVDVFFPPVTHLWIDRLEVRAEESGSRTCGEEQAQPSKLT